MAPPDSKYKAIVVNKYRRKELVKVRQWPDIAVSAVDILSPLFRINPVKKSEINDRGNPLRWPRNTIYPQKLSLLHQKAAVARSA
jgi:hypothetical protein